MPRSEKEGLLSRWSRLKHASAAKGAAPGESTSASRAAAVKTDVSAKGNTEENDATDALPDLPPLESLTPESDFQPFMDPRVADGVRRAALKTLFRSPAFNVTDGLDEYAGDYTKLETLTPAMVAALKHTRRTLFGHHDAPDEHGSAIAGTPHAETGQPEMTQCDAAPSVNVHLTDEDRGFASRREAHASQPQGDSGEAGDDLSVGEHTSRGDAVIAPDETGAPSAGRSSNERPGEQAGSKRNA